MNGSASGWGITADILKLDEPVWCNKCGFVGVRAGHNAAPCPYEPVPAGREGS